MFRADKSNKSSKRTIGASQNSVCPKCGYLLREQGRRCPSCFHQFEDHVAANVKDHRASNVEEHSGGNAMDKQRSGNMSPSREYLNHLNNQFLGIEAKRAALEELYIPLKMEHDELNNLIISVKHQIKREEALDDISKIEAIESSGSKKYKAEISYEEVDAANTEDKSEE